MMISLTCIMCIVCASYVSNEVQTTYIANSRIYHKTKILCSTNEKNKREEKIVTRTETKVSTTIKPKIDKKNKKCLFFFCFLFLYKSLLIC